MVAELKATGASQDVIAALGGVSRITVLRVFNGRCAPSRTTKIAFGRAIAYLKKGGSVDAALALLAADQTRQRRASAECGYPVDDSRAKRVAALQAKLREVGRVGFTASTGRPNTLRWTVLYRPNDVSDATLTALEASLGASA